MMKSIAIMQPYFFPYIGYWQLIHAVDCFVIYDDVNYIKGGWINRNRILINNIPTYITIPLHQSSPYKSICNTFLQPSFVWRDKLLKMIENTYRRSPYFSDIFAVIEKIIRCETDNLADFLAHQLQVLSVLMGIKTEFILTSRTYKNDFLSGQERVIDICKHENASVYINAIGGKTLYDSNIFSEEGINLNFIEMCPLPYKQKSNEFIPYLSIIDALMEVGSIGIKEHINSFELTK
jgi:hypothetical protein